MKICLKDTLFKLLFKNKKLISKRDTSLEISNSNGNVQFDEDSSKKIFKYQRYDNIKIDNNFKYYHFDLTGKVSKDFKILYGDKDIHNSKVVFKHSFFDNLLKIKRSSDIIVYKKDDIYIIYNGRHRLVYLSYYYQKFSFEDVFLIPALVTKEFDDTRVNEILNQLIIDFKATVYKVNYYDDNASFCIILNDNIYIVNNALELDDFNTNREKYLYTKLSEIIEIDFSELFRKIIDIVGDKFFEMNFLDLLDFIRDGNISIDNRIVTTENINIDKFYNYYFDICQSVQYCRIHDYEIPKDLNVLNATCLPINRFGHIIMEFLYENPFYQNFTWKELLEIIENFTEFEGYDAEFLLESARKFGYVEGIGKKFQKRKKDYQYW